MKKNLLYFLAVLLLPATGLAQADIHFSQFYDMSILRNPALTGVFTEDYKVGVVYRNQWSSITNPFQTAVINAEARLPISKVSNDFVSFGFLGYYDKAGSISQQIVGLYPAINYNKSLSSEHNAFLSVGFTGGYLQYSFDPSKATFNNQYQNNSYNPINSSGEQLPNPTHSVWDLGAGINFNTSTGEDNATTYVIGLAGYHFSQPDISYYQDPTIRMNMRWNINAAVSKQIDEDYTCQFQANYAMQGSYQEIIGGVMVGWNKVTNGTTPVFVLSAGVFYRVQDAIIPTVKIRYKDFTYAVSYDVNNSSLKQASNLQGGYEISIFKSGLFGDKYQSKNKLFCPVFY